MTPAPPTLDQLQARWQQALSTSACAVRHHPQAYRDLKALAATVAAEPLDIREYLPTARRLTGLLETLDTEGGGSIFHHFRSRVNPADIRQVGLLRVECRDLLAYLKALDRWRLEARGLRVLK